MIGFYFRYFTKKLIEENKKLFILFLDKSTR